MSPKNIKNGYFSGDMFVLWWVISYKFYIDVEHLYCFTLHLLYSKYTCLFVPAILENSFDIKICSTQVSWRLVLVPLQYPPQAPKIGWQITSIPRKTNMEPEIGTPGRGRFLLKKNIIFRFHVSFRRGIVAIIYGDSHLWIAHILPTNKIIIPRID